MINHAYDDIVGKAYDATLMKRLLKWVAPYKKLVVLGVFLNLLVAGLGPLRPYLTKVAIDKYISVGDYNGLLLIGIILLASLFLQSTAQYILAYYTQLMGQRIIRDMRVGLFKRVLKMSLKFFDHTPVGRLVTRVTNDVEALNDLFASGIVMIFSDIFILLWILGFMFFISWRLALVTLSVVPLLFYSTFLFRRKVRKAYRDIRLHLARLNSYMQERISGIHLVKIFVKEKKEFEKFTEINNEYKKANIRSVYYYALFFPVVEMIGSFAAALVLWYGGGQTLQGTVTIGALFAFMQYTEMFFRPIRDLSEKYNILQTAMASSERIFKMFDTPVDDEDGKERLKPKEIKGLIEFKNVWFAYDEVNYVLRNVSFKILPGQRVAIVGATGAGKTSIINILTGFYTVQKGAVLIDGVNINNYDKKELRKLISVVPQDTVLFSGSIKYNITLGAKEITEEEIKKAAKIAGADIFIENLKYGYEHLLGEGGGELSTGEKQLLSFARALAFNPRILILDEATSNIDTETEKLIQEATERILKERTSVIIAHRLSTIRHSDVIFVMHKGELREVGTHEELLHKKGIYYKLYRAQYYKGEN